MRMLGDVGKGLCGLRMSMYNNFGITSLELSPISRFQGSYYVDKSEESLHLRDRIGTDVLECK